jgi:hypothetical protein
MELFLLWLMIHNSRKKVLRQFNNILETSHSYPNLSARICSQDLDLGTVYSSIKWCEFPLALLILYGDDLADKNECRISNTNLPKVFID